PPLVKQAGRVERRRTEAAAKASGSSETVTA
ncbi:hypothetical protein AHiyo6_29730, partial [Arthrobacter sp. Hiyo6]